MRTNRPVVTQKDIAREVGVSYQLVGFALNDRPNVAPETKARILEAAERLGYSRGLTNNAARALAAQRHGTAVRHGIIAILWRRGRTAMPLNTPFYQQLLDGIDEATAESGTDIFLCNLHEDRLPRLVREKGVDGVIDMVGAGDVLQEVHRLGLPLVRFCVQELTRQSISPEGRQGTWLATRHLLALGHTRIAYLGHHADFSASAERIQGYQQAMQEAGLGGDPSLLETGLMVQEKGDAGARDLMARRPDVTAIVCHNDIVAMSAIDGLKQMGLNCPRDVSVTGFDNVAPDYNFSPRLTTIAFDRVAMGRRAVQLLLRDAAPTVPGSRTDIISETVPVTLVTGDSTAAPTRP